MRSTLRLNAIALMLCGGVGLAVAQTAPGPSGAAAPDYTVPPPGESQPQAPLADQAAPSAVGPAQSATAGKVADTVPGASRQTMPSTISADNAKLDKMSIVSLQLPLTDKQKRQIVDGLAKASVAPVGNVQTKVTETLPAHVLAQQLPGDLATQVPETARYKYVKLTDRILLIDPTNWWVVSEIRT